MLNNYLDCSDNEILSWLSEHGNRANVGFEREGLRIGSYSISKNPHPKSLGSALCNKFITTDFSEAQLEIVTPPYENKNKAIEFLDDVHHYISHNIEDEIIWPFSMPPDISKDEDIAIASYGTSNLARFKSLYRNGLSARYGKMMQAISGVHYNFSISDSIWKKVFLKNNEIDSKSIRSSGYFNLLRNIYRVNWLIFYLFGSSPVLTKNFLTKDPKEFKNFDKQTLYMPYSTTLRMSEFGYQNENRKKLEISINSIEQYILGLQRATSTADEEFRKIKSHDPNIRAQINENILQVDDEYYAIARVKSQSITDKPATSKLKETGVDFIELRSLDTDPFSSTGINEETVYFLEVLLTYCFIKESIPYSPEDIKVHNYNESLVAKEGRKPNLKLNKNGIQMGLSEWGNQIIDKLYPVADALDCNKKKYSRAVESAKNKINNPNLTLSAQVLDLLNSKNTSFLELGMNIGNANKQIYLKKSKSKNKSWNFLSKEAKQSLIKQEFIENSDKLSFEAYLESYFNRSN